MKNSIINRQFKYSDKNATMMLIAANVIVFLLCQIVPRLTYDLALVPLYIRGRHYYWQIFTYMFVSGSIWHLLSNMIALLLFGRVVEHAVGTREFLLYYLLVGTLAGAAAYGYCVFAGRYQMVILGASGAVYSIMLLFAVLLPSAVVLVFGIIPVRAPILVLLYFFIDFFGQFTSDGIAHNVHLFGLLFGVLYITIRMRINPLKAWGIMD